MPGSEKRFGILIACQDYPADSGFHSLTCPERDAVALREVLMDPDHGEFDTVEIIANKTRSEILIALEETLHAAAQDDLVFIYFSGHGKLDRKGNLFFAAANTRADRLRATGINAADLSDIILDSVVRKKALVLDCCYAGAFARNWKSAADIMQDRVEAFSRGAGTYVLMATDELSLAEEDAEAGISVFTRHLVDGLRGAADINRDGIITLTELSNYVHAQVVDLHNQRPIEAGIEKRDEIAISKSGLLMNPVLAGDIRTQLIAWADRGDIPDRVLSETLAVLAAIGDGSVADADRPRCRLLERMYSAPLGPGTFVYEWLNIAGPSDPGPPPDETPQPTPEIAGAQMGAGAATAQEPAAKGGSSDAPADPGHLQEILARFNALEEKITNAPGHPTQARGGALTSGLLIFGSYFAAGATAGLFEVTDFPAPGTIDQNAFTGMALAGAAFAVIFYRRSRPSPKLSRAARVVNLVGMVLNISLIMPILFLLAG